jgi:hypothetical protein
MSYRYIQFYGTSNQDYPLLLLDIPITWSQYQPGEGLDVRNISGILGFDQWTDGTLYYGPTIITYQNNGATLHLWPSPLTKIVYLSGYNSSNAVAFINTTYNIQDGIIPNHAGWYKIQSIGAYSNLVTDSLISYYAGYTLGSSELYFVYAAEYTPLVIYFPSVTDALNNRNFLFGTDNFTLLTSGSTTAWYLANTSQGSSPKGVAYAAGSTLIGDGYYYIYPSTGSNVFYYQNKTDALAKTNSIFSANSFIITVPLGYTYSNWILASNTTGTLTSDIIVYTSGTTLESNGKYYLYPASSTPTAYSILYFSTERSASSNLSRLLLNTGSSSTYRLSNLYGVTNWRIYSGYGTTTIPSGTLIHTSLLTGSLLLYPTIENVVFFYSQLITNIYTNDNLIVGLSRNYNTFLTGCNISWLLSDFSTGSSSKFRSFGSVSAAALLNANGVYYLYPGFIPGTNVYYYTNKSAAAQAAGNTTSIPISPYIANRDSYTVETFLTYSNWISYSATSTSAMSASLIVYQQGTVLNPVGVTNSRFILYPAISSCNYMVIYNANSASFSQKLSYLLSNSGFSSIYTIQSIFGVSNWFIQNCNTTIATDRRTPNGTLLSSGSIIDTNALVAPLYLTPASPFVNLYYYSESITNFAASDNLVIGLSSSYIVQTIGGYSSWIISGLSTGSSSKLLSYTTGSVLNPGTYYLYPGYIGSNITYYTTKALALAQSNTIFSSASYTIPTIPGYSTTSNFIVASNSTGSSSGLFVYARGETLNPNGFYYLYNLTSSNVPSYTIVYFSSQLSAASNISRILSNTYVLTAALSRTYTLSNIYGISNWTVHSGYTTTTARAGSVIATSVLTGPLFLYPTESNAIFYYSQPITNVLASDNLIIGRSSSYTLETIQGYSNWVIGSTSTGSSSRVLVYTTGTTLNSNGQYYLYPPTSTAYSIRYFSSPYTASLNSSNIRLDSGTASTYTLSNLYGVSNWTIYSGYATTTITAGSVLATSVIGSLFLHPTGSNNVFYYSQLITDISKSDTYIIGLSPSYIVQTVNTYSNWALSTSSTGSSSGILLYSTGRTLNSRGFYYLYPITSSSYNIKYFSSKISAISNASVMLSNTGTSSTYTLSNVYGVSNWTIHSGYNEISISAGSILLPSVLAGTLFLYPTVANNVFYYSQSISVVVASDNLIIGLSPSYTLGTFQGNSSWIISPTSTGNSAQTISYTSGSTLSGNILNKRVYYLYPGTTGSNVFYYTNQTDAERTMNAFASSNTYTLATLGGYSSWHIASNSTGSSSQAAVYDSGMTLNPANTYHLYPSIPCFLEGTKILCLIDSKEQYVNIESIRKGTLVKTSLYGYNKVTYIGYSSITNYASSDRFENRLYICKKDKYPTLDEDLILTGAHSILVDTLNDRQIEETLKSLGDIFVTGNKYRLMAFLDPNAEPWASEGVYTVWHIALDHPDIFKNYGIYANGLLVESASIRFLRDKSNMIFV